MSGTSSTLRSQLYQAGAGAGKTRKLTETIVASAQQFKAEQGRFPRIVVTTFTRKATQELRERLMLKADEIGDVELTEFLVSPSFVHISTIHGVFHKFLARFGHRFGIDPAFEVIDERRNRYLAKRALKNVMFQRDSNQNLLEEYDVNLLVEMLLGYYEASLGAKEMRAMSRQDLDETIKDLRAEFKGRALDIAKQIDSQTDDVKWSELAQNLKSLSFEFGADDWKKTRDGVLRLLAGIKKPAYRKDSAPVTKGTNDLADSFLKELREIEGDLYNPELWPNFFEVIGDFDPMAKSFVSEFQKLKRFEGVLSMSDLELIAMTGIREHPDTAKAFSEEWDYWLIDEFQDTSPLQNRVLIEMIGRSAYFVVGDPQQSIYLFRGARAEVFREQKAKMEREKGEIHSLSVNYRSTSEVVRFFNEFFTALNSSFVTMEPAGKEKSSVKVPITFFKAANPKDELAGIVERVKGLLANGAAPESICILARTHDVLSEIAGLLYAAKVPVFLHSNSGFTERREVQDAVALLKFLVNPDDNKNLVQLLRTPWYRINDADLVTQLSGAPVSYWDQLRKLELPAVVLLRSLLAQCRETGISHTFVEALCFHGAIDFSLNYDGSGRRESNLWKLVTLLHDAQCEPDFNFIDFIADYTAEGRATELIEESDAVAAIEPQRVNLMTVHRSKGLQFRHVMIPDMNRQPRNTVSTPFMVDEAKDMWMLSIQLGEDAKRSHSLAGRRAMRRKRDLEIEESDRVLYVAITRAVETVFLSWSGEPRKNSWAERMKWPLDIGVHSREGYAFEVVDSVAPVTNYVPPERASVRVRAGYAPAAKSEASASVSELLNKTDFGTDNLARTKARLKKSLDGVVIHSLFESLRYSTELAPEILRMRFGDRAPAIERAISYVKGLKEVPMTELLKTGFAEWGFTLSEQGKQYLGGRLDLWGRANGEAWIIDYKTGDPERVQEAFDQLSLYSIALRRFGVTEPIKLGVVFPLSEQVHVRDAPSESEVLKKYFLQ